MQKILITGAAGFIGFHLAKRLLKKKNYNFQFIYGDLKKKSIYKKNFKLHIQKN